MIRQLRALLGSDVNTALLYAVVAAVLQGIAFVLLVPILRALFGNPSDAWPWLGALLVAGIAYGVVFFRGALAGYDVGGGLLRTLHHRLGDHMSVLPLGWFTPARVGEVSTLVSQGVMGVANAPAHLLRPLVSAFVTPATVVVLMALFDWRIALATLATAPLIALSYWWSGRLVERAERGTVIASAQASTRVVEFAQNQPLLRSTGQTDRGWATLDAALAKQRDEGRKLIVKAVPGMVLFAIVVQLAFAAVLLFGTYLAVGGSLSTPDLLALLVLAARFVEPIWMAADLGGALKLSRGALNRVQDVLDSPPLPQPSTPKAPTTDDVTFEDVTFGYNGSAVVKGVSLQVPARSMTALVGPSGSGKTTLTKLAARFFDVDSGSVRVGGVDVREMTTEQLMGQLSLVFQDVYLFDDTIFNNIRLAKPEATDAEVFAAAGAARVDEIIARLPDGWQTRVGEGGTSLSGGERQRVSIARAILKDAPIVMLDEATAALDLENEAAVRDALKALTTDRTLVAIAHRLSTVVNADQVVFLEDGRVTATGRHDELIQRGGRYAEFWKGAR